MTWKQPTVVAALLCTAIVATVADVQMKKSRASASEERRLIIRSGTLFTKDGVPIQLSEFDSEIESDKSQQSASASAPKQISGVLVRSGSVFVRAEDLSRLLQSRVNNSKLTDLAVATDGSELKISGHLKKAIPVHFEIKGPVSLSQDGFIDLHESSVNVDKLPMKGLSQLLGMDPSHIVGQGAAKGLRGSKEDILMDPNALWGMPVRGKLSQVKVVNDGLMLLYGETGSRSTSGSRAHQSKSGK